MADAEESELERHMTVGVGRWAEGFLLDFDGPVCDLFPVGGGSTIAEEARGPLRSGGVVMPGEVLETNEHLVVLEFAGRCAPEGGRPYARPDLMKPNSFLADQARAILGRERCCMIGDSPSDIEFGRRAGLPCIAYAKSARHEARLTPAGPDAVVRDLAMLAEWI